MLLLNQAVDSAYLHIPPPFSFQSTFGGWIRETPANYVKRGRVSSGSAPFLFSISEAIREVLPVINRTPLFPSNADFNQISSVWAKCRYWQAVRSLGSPE